MFSTGTTGVNGADATNERMRIDSAGNLLVGKTAVTLNTEGHAITPTYARFTRNGAEPVQLNRLTSDGSILGFYKDGTTVGSIGSYNDGASAPYFADAGNVGIRLSQASTDDIVPCTSTGADRDNAINLGSSGARWKDLYLSGGVYLGGTGAANLLDDYEEGTWTPTVGGTWTTSPTTLSGTYIKVGSLVYVKVQFLGGAKSSAIAGWIDGLPFNQAGGATTGSVSDAGVNDRGNCLFANTTRIWLTATSFSGTNYLSGCYNTDA